MINGFFHTIQQDGLDLYKACSNQTPRTADQVKRISLAAIRILAAGIMGVGVIIAASAVPFALISPISTLFKVAIGAALYALGHDLFVISKRMSEERENPLRELQAGILGGLRNLSTLFRCHHVGLMGNLILDQRTKDTFFQPIWKVALKP